MGFSYDDAIDIVINMQTYRNADGTAMTIAILNGLKHCPFVSVVAELNEISIHHLYRLMDYYLGKAIVREILNDVGTRRGAKLSELKEKERESLKSLLGY